MQASKDTIDLGELARNEKTGRTFYLTDYPSDYAESIRWTLSNSTKRGDLIIRPTGDGRLEVNFELKGDEDDLGSHRRKLTISCGELSVSLMVIYSISPTVQPTTIGNVVVKQRVVVQPPAPTPQVRTAPAQPAPQPRPQTQAYAPPPAQPRPRYRTVRNFVFTTPRDVAVLVIAIALVFGFMLIRDSSFISDFAIAGIQIFNYINPNNSIDFNSLPDDAPVDVVIVTNAHYPCDGSFASYLYVGSRGQVVSRDPSINIRLRNEPGNDNSIYLVMTHGTTFEVINGPSCQYEAVWWNIRLENGNTGWAAESLDGFYYLQPI